MDRRALELLVWKHTHRDFRGRGSDGVRRVLRLSPQTGATESWPLSSFSDEEHFAKLPRGVRESFSATKG